MDLLKQKFCAPFFRTQALFKSFTRDRSGAVVVEFAICSLMLIPFFLGLSDVLRANQVKQSAMETGESILRAMLHVPEYDASMRTALTVFCDMNRYSLDDFDIEIASGLYSGSSYAIDWNHYPCGAVSASYVPMNEADLDSELGALNLQANEGFVAVKVVHVANSLETSKYFYVPQYHTFEFLDAGIPRIANTVIYTEEDLYDIDSYEY